MTNDILSTLLITGGGLALFAWGRIRPDVVAVMVMTTLMLSGLVSFTEGISGFSNEAMLTVAAMFVLSAGLVRTGAIDLLGGFMGRLAGGSEYRLLVVSMAMVVPLSAVLNNTPVVAVMVPMVMGLAGGSGVRASKILMPLSFAGQMGGTLTLIGTSTNLLVAGLVLELGVGRLRLFDITPPALIMTAVGTVYLLTIGRRLTPARKPGGSLVDRYRLRQYVTALEIGPGSQLVDRTLGEIRFGTKFGLDVLAVDRQGERITAPTSTTRVREGDVLVASGSTADIARMRKEPGIKMASSASVPPDDVLENAVAAVEESDLAELIVPQRSTLLGRTLGQMSFRSRHGIAVLGVQRHGAAVQERPRDVVLQTGDLLLAQGDAESLLTLHEHGDLMLLGIVRPPIRRRRKLALAVVILLGVVCLAAFDILPILLAALLGVVAMLLTGCVAPEETYSDVDWSVLVLLGAIIPLGIAMQNSGTADFIARGILGLATPLGPLGVLVSFYLLTSILTEVISNNAAAVVMTPIAIATAESLDISALPLVVAVMFAASNSFMTPIGYQTNMFVYSPGGYRFTDFFRVGGPLNLLMTAAAALAIPWFFPF
jgi:di/tricarboxylate transporter